MRNRTGNTSTSGLFLTSIYIIYSIVCIRILRAWESGIICALYTGNAVIDHFLFSLSLLNGYIWVHTQSLFPLNSFFLFIPRLVLYPSLVLSERISAGNFNFSSTKEKNGQHSYRFLLRDVQFFLFFCFFLFMYGLLKASNISSVPLSCAQVQLFVSLQSSPVCLLLVFSQLCHILPSGIQPLGQLLQIQHPTQIKKNKQILNY